MEFIVDKLVCRFGASKVALGYLTALISLALIFLALARYMSSFFYWMALGPVITTLVGLNMWAKAVKDLWARQFKGFQLDKQPNVESVPKGFLIDLLLPPDRAEDALVNMLRRYDYWVVTHGARKARVIFATQSIFVVISYWTDWALRRLKFLDLFRRS